MKLNKKISFGTFTALGIQVVFGINSANAGPCDDYIKREFSVSNEINSYPYSSLKEYGDMKYRVLENSIFTQQDTSGGKFRDGGGAYPNCSAFVKSRLEIMVRDKYTDNSYYCFHKIASENNCNNLNGFKFDLDAGGNRLSAYKFGDGSNNKSSNQSSATAQSNSLESYNIQVSQTNKQNYLAMQRAYEQANAGKGKKNNLKAVAPDCMKNNPSQQTFKNNCNESINFSYCFSGIVPGNRNENPDTLAEMSCQNGQFGTITLGAGENIPGSYKGMVLEGLACKSPSQPIMAFDKAANAVAGRCSY